MIKLLTLLASFGLTTSSVSMAAISVKNVNVKTETLSVQQEKLKIGNQLNNNTYKITVSNKITDSKTQIKWEGSYDIILKQESPGYAFLSTVLTFENFQGDLRPINILGNWVSLEGDTIEKLDQQYPAPPAEVAMPKEESKMTLTWGRPKTSWVKGAGSLMTTWLAPDGQESVNEKALAIVDPYPRNINGDIYPVLTDLTGRLALAKIEGGWVKDPNPLPWTEKEQNEAKQWFNENVEGTIDWNLITMYHIRALEFGGSNDPYENIMLLPKTGGITDKLDDWWKDYSAELSK